MQGILHINIILRVFRFEISMYCTMFTLQTSFKPFSLGGGGGGVKFAVETTMNSKDENSQDFCPNNVQEFGFWLNFCQLRSQIPTTIRRRSQSIKYSYSMAHWRNFVKISANDSFWISSKPPISARSISSWDSTFKNKKYISVLRF